jgi:hypothetical protein
VSRVRATSPSVIPHAAPWAPTPYIAHPAYLCRYCRLPVLMPAGVRSLTNSVVLTLVYDIYMYSPHTRIFTMVFTANNEPYGSFIGHHMMHT